MKQTGYSIYFLGLLPLLLLYANRFSPHQIHSPAVYPAIADTSSPGDSSTLFTPNAEAGWDTLVYYINQDTPDTVEFEVVIKHDNNINWNEEHFIGTIADSLYKPLNSQYVSYQLLIDNNWNLRIEPNGQCFLMQENGPPPTEDPAIVPIRIRYKNN